MAKNSFATPKSSSGALDMERSDKEMALVAMCCGGLGTGTLIQRV